MRPERETQGNVIHWSLFCSAAAETAVCLICRPVLQTDTLDFGLLGTSTSCFKLARLTALFILT